MLSLSLLLIGIGQTALMTLGIPFIDDNVKAAQSSLYIAITIGVRILGPLLGYYLASYCLSLYVDLSQDVDPSDNNFIGAWWLGKIPTYTFSFLSHKNVVWNSHVYVKLPDGRRRSNNNKKLQIGRVEIPSHLKMHLWNVMRKRIIVPRECRRRNEDKKKLWEI